MEKLEQLNFSWNGRDRVNVIDNGPGCYGLFWSTS